jgi:cobalamin synthase
MSMRKLAVAENVTLDGVLDTSDGWFTLTAQERTAEAASR